MLGCSAERDGSAAPPAAAIRPGQGAALPLHSSDSCNCMDALQHGAARAGSSAEARMSLTAPLLRAVRGKAAAIPGALGCSPAALPLRPGQAVRGAVARLLAGDTLRPRAIERRRAAGTRTAKTSTIVSRVRIWLMAGAQPHGRARAPSRSRHPRRCANRTASDPPRPLRHSVARATNLHT